MVALCRSLAITAGLCGCYYGTDLDQFQIRDGGSSWWHDKSPVTTGELFGIWGSAADDIYAVGTGGTILHSTRRGEWTVLDSPTTQTLYAIWGAAPDDVFAVGAAGTVVHFDGSTWAASTIASADLHGVWGASGHDVYAVGAAGTIVHFDGAWSAQTSGTTQDLFAVSGTSASDVVVTGHNPSGVLHSIGDGSWVREPLDLMNQSIVLRCVVVDNFARLAGGVYGTSGQIWADNGTSWARIQTFGQTILALWSAPTGEIVAAGSAGMIRWSTDRSLWKIESTDMVDWNAAWGSSAHDVYLVGSGGRILHRQ